MADLRELLILVLALLIVFSLLRAVFVIHRRKKGQIRLSIDKSISQSMELEQPEEEDLDELPNGGARPVLAGGGDAVLAREAEPAAAAPEVDEHVPVLTDVVKIAPLAAASSQQQASPAAATRQPEPAPERKQQRKQEREQQREDAGSRHRPEAPLRKTSKRNWKAEIYAANGAPNSRSGAQNQDRDRDQHPEFDLGAVSMTAGERIGEPSGRLGRNRNSGNGAARPQTTAAPKPAAASQKNNAPESNTSDRETDRLDRETDRSGREAHTIDQQRQQPQAANNASEHKPEPERGQAQAHKEPREAAQNEPRKEPCDDADSADAAVSPDQIIALHVIAEEGQTFAGAETWNFLLAASLRYDDMKIFSKYDGNRDRTEPVFRVANLVNPGIFDSDDIEGLHIPGISLFMLLPTPIDNMRAFEQMLTVARRFAETFDGRLLDSRRQELTLESIEAIRRRIREFEMSAFGPSSVSSLI